MTPAKWRPVGNARQRQGPATNGCGRLASSLLKVQKLKSVIDIISELQRWKGTTRCDGVDFDERFEAVKELGAGAFGTVYRERKEDGAAFAAKTVLSARAARMRGSGRRPTERVESWTALSSPVPPCDLQLIEVVHVGESSTST